MAKGVKIGLGTGAGFIRTAATPGNSCCRMLNFADIHQIRKVLFVMKEGVVYRYDRAGDLRNPAPTR